jgi:hypothetical protein
MDLFSHPVQDHNVVGSYNLFRPAFCRQISKRRKSMTEERKDQEVVSKKEELSEQDLEQAAGGHHKAYPEAPKKIEGDHRHPR